MIRQDFANIGLGSVIVLLLGASNAQARCQTAPYRFFPAQNDSVTVYVTCDRRGGRLGWRSRSGIEYTAAQVVTHPRSGRLKDDDALTYFYHPNPGFRGRDNYVVRVCGRPIRGGYGC
ncbi:MAG: hypothetical protein ACRCYS_17935, partial [Beijerinckiaceae bacterium]